MTRHKGQGQDQRKMKYKKLSLGETRFRNRGGDARLCNLNGKYCTARIITGLNGEISYRSKEPIERSFEKAKVKDEKNRLTNELTN